MTSDAEKLLGKSSRSIRVAEQILENGELDFAASRAYYAMFYIAVALLREKGFRFKKHGGVHAAFAEQFIKTKLMDEKFHGWLVDAFDERIRGDYDIETVVDSAEVKLMITRAREFLQEAQRYLASQQ